MAVAFFWRHFPTDFWPINNGGEPVVLLCFAFLLLVFTGPGGDRAGLSHQPRPATGAIIALSPGCSPAPHIVRLIRRAAFICSAVNSVPSAAMFSSTRATRLVPGTGAMSPLVSNQAIATCAEVAPVSTATA
jgi:hypothetical protein